MDSVRSAIAILQSDSAPKEHKQQQCVLLADLAMNYAAVVPEVITASDGVEAIVSALRSSPDTIPLQLSGIQALSNIAFGGSETSNSALKARIVQSGGVDVILEAMRRHPLSTAVQEKGCSSLSSICVRDNLEYLVLVRGIPTVLQAIDLAFEPPTIASEKVRLRQTNILLCGFLILAAISQQITRNCRTSLG